MRHSVDDALDARRRGRSGLSALAAYMSLTCVAGLPLAGWVTGHGFTLDPPGWQVLVLAAVLVIGELLPIEVSRRGRSTDEITISSTFALALILVAPLAIAIAAQALPLLVDDLRRGKHWGRPLFNVAQYSITFAVTRAVYCLVSGQAFLSPEPFTRPDLLAAFAAGGAFFLVNHTLVGTAVALWSHEPVLPHLLEDLRFQLATSGLLVALAPVVLVLSDFSLLLVPVLLLPIAAVRTSARLAIQREHDALHDPLTGLPNRSRLHLEVERALAVAQRSQRGIAVLLLDLDHFKEINDTLGHNVGDQLIVEVGARLTGVADADVLVTRLGGDEFAVLATPTVPVEGLPAWTEELVGRLAASLREPMTLSGVRVDVQASIGIAYAPQHAAGIDELLSRADVAMYTAKQDRGTWATYDPDGDEHTPERLALLAELRDGLRDRELLLHFQPKCDAATGRVLGAEALVRWQHPTRGLVYPDEFIALAENTGLITELTLQVLDQALEQAGAWSRAGTPLGVAVNLSVRHLTDLSLPGQVAQILTRHDVRPDRLTLEVTESTIMNDPHRAVQILAHLRSLGVRLAVDDYGTGYSSLAYLKRLDVDELKIDKSFILGMLGDDSDAIIVRSTIELGHNLGLQIVAEGVENDAAWQRLKRLNCDQVQGYHISRPMPADAFLPWVTRWHADLDATASAPALRPTAGLPAALAPPALATCPRTAMPTELPARSPWAPESALTAVAGAWLEGTRSPC